MSAFLLFATALTGQALIEEADRRNEVYAACLFKTVREARAMAFPAGDLATLLSVRCKAEREAYRPLFVDIRREQGEKLADAEASWERVHANSIEAIRKAYVLRLDEDAANDG